MHGEFLDAGEGTIVDDGDEHVVDRQGELPRLTEGLRTTTGLLLDGERHGEAAVEETSFILGDILLGVGVGILGGDVSSRIAWLRTSTFGFVLIWNKKKITDS